MAIINRTMDLSEQKEGKTVVATNVANATEVILAIAERACTITDVKASLVGISGAPNVLLRVQRFIPGTGGSTFNIGSTFVVGAFGTSGYMSVSLPAVGSTLLNLQKGDVVSAIQGGGSGAASTGTVIELITQNLQDIKTWF